MKLNWQHTHTKMKKKKHKDPPSVRALAKQKHSSKGNIKSFSQHFKRFSESKMMLGATIDSSALETLDNEI